MRCGCWSLIAARFRASALPPLIRAHRGNACHGDVSASASNSALKYPSMADGQRITREES